MATRKPIRVNLWQQFVPLALIGAFLVFGLGYSIGKYGIPPHQPVQTTISGKPVDLTDFWQAKRLIEQKYVGKVDSQTLITDATKGLVAGTGDPYSDYLTKDEAKQLDDELSGTVEGIGVEIGQKDGNVQVVSPFPDTPAAQAGIQAGDVIVSVDGQPVQGKSIDEVAKLIRGPHGKEVTVEVKTGDAPARSLKMTRQTIKSPSATVTYQDNVAIISLTRFGDDTKAAMDKITTDIQTKHPRGIILDLRGNPGGFLDGAVQVTSLFQKEGLVVKEQLKDKTETESVSGNAPLADYPLVVLVNKGSASAAEITAGALRDDKGTKLVGEQTYGKGSVQELQPLGGGSVLKLTIAEWLTPKGTSISKAGLKPDVVVGSDNPDAQLAAAIAQLGS